MRGKGKINGNKYRMCVYWWDWFCSKVGIDNARGRGELPTVLFEDTLVSAGEIYKLASLAR